MRDNTFYEYAKVSVRDRLSWWDKLRGKDEDLRQNYMLTQQAIKYQENTSTYYDIEIEPMPKGWKPKDIKKEVN